MSNGTLKISGLVSDGKIPEADKGAVAALPSLDFGTMKSVLGDASPVKAPQPTELAKVGDSIPPVGRLVSLPVHSIVRSRYQVRTMGDEEDILSLMESLQSSGIISPPVVRPLPNGSYELVAGEHRWEGWRRLGHTEILVIVRNLSDQAAALALTEDNAVRKTLDDYDRYKHARMLRENGFVKTERDVAKALGIKPAHVTFVNAFGDLPEIAIELIEQNPGKIGADCVYGVRDLAKTFPEQVTKAFQQIIDGKMRQKDIRNWVAAHTGSHTKPYREELSITRPDKPAVRIVVTGTEARIVYAGLNSKKLQALITEHIDDLATN